MKSLRALIVACPPEDQHAISAMLDPYGFVCVQVIDGPSGLRCASEEAVDLFVINIDDPLLGGRELVEAVRSGKLGANPPPVILYSGQAGASGMEFIPGGISVNAQSLANGGALSNALRKVLPS